MNKSGIKKKVMIMTAISMVLLTAVVAGIGYVMFNSYVLAKYAKYAEMVVNCSETIFEEYNMGDMIERREMNENYEVCRDELNQLKDNADIKYLYSVFFDDLNDIHSVRYSINAKSSEERNTGEPLEEIYSYMDEPCEEDAFQDYMLDSFVDAIRHNDKSIHVQEDNTTQYGRLITCSTVVRNSKGEPVGILAADIDVSQIDTELGNYLRTVILSALVVTILSIILFVMQIDNFITSPLNSLAHSTSDFVKLMKDKVKPEELIYKKPKKQGRDEILMLSDGVENLAEGVKNYMVNLRDITKEKERIGAELNVATQIQADMLPRIFPAFPDRNEFDLYATMSPAKEVGGDFYDFFLIDDDHVGLVIADVSGKGVPAALFMVIAKTLIKNRAQMGGSPAEVLSFANDQLCEGNEAELFVTVWFASIEISTGKGIAANAGHEHPAIRHGDGDWELVVYKHSPAVATMEGMMFKEHEFEIHEGDCLFVYTDGVTEATNAQNELFGEERLLNALNRDKTKDPSVYLKNVRADIDAFVAEAPQFDDITMLGVHWGE